MPKVNVYNQSNEQVGEIELDDSVFAAEVKEHLLHFVVRKQLAARRAGTHAVKRRSDVRGGGRKPYRQKGTGRARQGSTRSPQFRGGGVVFGPEPRSYDFKVNRKERQAALRSAISLRASAGDLIVLDDLAFEAPRTKDFKAFMAAFGLEDVLVVSEDPTGNVGLASRNLQEASFLPAQGLNVYDVLRRGRLVLTRSAVDAVTSRLGGN
jgi:large subunit ribosomal protein L4